MSCLFSGDHSSFRLSRFPDLRRSAPARLLTPCGAMTFCAGLSVHSDRFVRDSHPVPFYLSADSFEHSNSRQGIISTVLRKNQHFFPISKARKGSMAFCC